MNKKELFFKSKSFSTHYHIKSGDDDLFINQVANRKNTAVVLHPESFTYSHPKKNWSEWWRQKQRHLTTAPHYKSSTRFSLGFSYMINYLLYALIITCACFNTLLIFAGGALFIKWLTQVIIYGTTASRLKEKGIVGIWFGFDLLFLFIYPALHLTKRFFKPNKWMN